MAARKKSTTQKSGKAAVARKAASTPSARKTTGAKKATGKKVASKKAASKKSAAAANSGKADAEVLEPRPEPEAAVPRKGARRAHPDAGLTRAQVKQLWERLVEERDKLSVAIRGRVGVATADATPLAEDGDIAQRATEQDYQLRLADKHRKLLNQILAAMDKFEIGEYGICEGTEEPIGFPRLQIRPWARYSVEHKEQLDRQNR